MGMLLNAVLLCRTCYTVISGVHALRVRLMFVVLMQHGLQTVEIFVIVFCLSADTVSEQSPCSGFIMECVATFHTLHLLSLAADGR